MFKKIWGWLDGSKTTIGSLILAAAPHLPDDWQVFAYIIGGAIAGTGGVHKVRKKLPSGVRKNL